MQILRNILIITIALLIINSITMAQELEYVSSLFWSGINDVTIISDYAYCAFDNGLYVIDISNIDNPEFVGQCYTGGRIESIDIDSNLACLSDQELRYHIINVSSPSNPALIGSYETSDTICAICINGDYLYCALENTGMVIMDIADPLNPVLISTYETAININNIRVNGGYAFIVCNCSLEIVNVNDPEEPLLEGIFTPSSGCITDVFIYSLYAYVANSYAGFLILDISNPADPDSIGGSDACYPRDIVVSDNIAVIVEYDTNELFDVSDPAMPEWVGSYETNYTRRVFAINNHTFIPDRYVGLLIMDVEEPSDPYLAGSYNTPGYINSVYILGDRAFITEIGFGFTHM